MKPPQPPRPPLRLPPGAVAIPGMGAPPTPAPVAAPPVPAAAPPPHAAAAAADEDEHVLFDRKSIPDDLLGHVTPESVARWKASAGRRYDTFIGITTLADAAFHLYPVFVRYVDRTTYTRAQHGQLMRLGQNIAPDDLLTTILIRDRPAKEQFRAAEVLAAYGPGNFIVTTPDLQFSWDGQAHQECCRKARVMETEVLGWSIKGSNNKGNSVTVRFVSSRNMGHFKPRTKERPGREGRDVPKQWARWIADVLMRDLNLKSGKFFGKTPEWGRTEGEKSAKFCIMKVGSEK